MNREDCKIGAKVRWYGEGEFTIESEPDDKNRLMVSGRHAPGHPVAIDDLHLIDEALDKVCAAKTQALIDKAKTAFEEAYQAYKAAYDTSHENGMGLYEMKNANMISLDDLEEVVESSGWSMSTLDCSIHY